MYVQNLKCVVIGDGTVGKTSLLLSYQKNEFPTTYIPTVYDTNVIKINRLQFYPQFDNLDINLTLCDTAGQEEYDRLRLLSYSEADIFLLCFSIMSPDSFANIKTKWYPELKNNSSSSKIILVGTKKDLKEDTNIIYNLKRSGQLPIDYQKAQQLKKEINAYKYIECSAKTKENVKLLFEEAIRSCLKIKDSKKCFFL